MQATETAQAKKPRQSLSGMAERLEKALGTMETTFRHLDDAVPDDWVADEEKE